MNYQLRYLGKSELRTGSGGSQALAFSPNLARGRVFFDAEIREPLRFREAMSALHEVVVGDLRAKKKDRSAWLAWKTERQREEDDLRRIVLDRARVEEAKRVHDAPPPNLDADFRKMHRLYWGARRQWANELSRDDPALFRALIPCDPVVTVAPDVVLFECFAKDESAYGALTVARDAFGAENAAGLGTTNVDYSLALYEHFQTLRSYRSTRLLVDPSGFEVATSGASGIREEKIDLPPSWLRGFGQLQAATALPGTRVELSVDVVYSLLAWLKRHREKAGPRSLRLKLVPGEAPSIVVDPWGVELRSRGAAYDGPTTGEIKLWGRRRLMALARLLPMTERFEVLVFGSGMPSIWVAHMGEMRFVLGLSGWTANDWTRGSNLDAFFAGFDAPVSVTDGLARALEATHRATLDELERQVRAPRKQVLGGLYALAKRGQLVYDFSGSLYRWRPLLPIPLSESLLGPENEETVHARRLVSEQTVTLERDEPLAGGRRLLVARVRETSCEGIVDLDGAFRGAKCSCSFFHKNRLRAGPCRHLMALRTSVLDPPPKGATPETTAARARTLVVHLPEAVLLTMRREAERRGLDVSSVAEQAWRIARGRVEQAARLTELYSEQGANAADAYRTSAKTAIALSLSQATEEEIQRQAARFDVAVSQVVGAAWHLAFDVMRFTSSLLS